MHQLLSSPFRDFERTHRANPNRSTANQTRVVRLFFAFHHIHCASHRLHSPMTESYSFVWHSLLCSMLKTVSLKPPYKPFCWGGCTDFVSSTKALGPGGLLGVVVHPYAAPSLTIGGRCIYNRHTDTSPNGVVPMPQDRPAKTVPGVFLLCL